VATRAGWRLEVTTGRGVVEVAEVTRTGPIPSCERGQDFRLATFSPEEIATLYLNGKYFHRDPGKRATLAALGPETEKPFRYFLYQYALEAVRQSAVVSNIIRRAKADGSLK
jgi:hypothetical protein